MAGEGADARVQGAAADGTAAPVEAAQPTAQPTVKTTAPGVAAPHAVPSGATSSSAPEPGGAGFSSISSGRPRAVLVLGMMLAYLAFSFAGRGGASGSQQHGVAHAASDAVAEFDEDDGFGDFESDDYADLDAVEPKEPHISGMPTIPVHQVRILLCTA